MAKAFNLTPRARENLRAIWRYTAEICNETQANAYVTKLHERFGGLTKRPRIGKHRFDICEGYSCFPESQHLIFYLIHKHRIDVIGVPHKAMDILNYFDTQG